MRYFGRVFVEFRDENGKWRLSAVKWWQYLLMRLWGYCGHADANPYEYEYRHVPRSKIKITH